MTDSNLTDAQDRDIAVFESVQDASNQDLLAYAAKQSGQTVIQVTKAFSDISKLDGKLTLKEFVRYGLYDPAHPSQATRTEFIANDLRWPIAHTCNPGGWNSAAEDKVLAGTILGAGGVPVPEAIGVIDRSARVFPGLPKIETADALRDLLLLNGPDLFGKIIGGMVSFGAFSVESADQTHLTCVGQGPMTYDAFLTDFVGSNTYVIQRRLSNHSDIRPYAVALCTVRMVNLLTSSGVKSPMAVIKMPQGSNIADAYWRAGNLACSIDVATGNVETVTRRNGMQIEFLDDHPDTAGLKGLTLPHWDKLQEVNRQAASIFAPIRYQSTDIAITETGPVVVELNYGGGFDLPQNASGRGFLTSEVRQFFEDCGYQFSGKDKRENKPSGGFSLFRRKRG
ncbi:hypothetical protein GTA62_14505 [Roseobacter sp. HKCCD9010]|uniref:sugar-transfer associated ATP-grasp domain-containing protein n=1 Tax=unclassified Roseobacter TaxID=196798 RepID=UPI001490F7F6|nr:MULTISPECIES: sugar-transfer associated ATP-grasp domain-containing protein [unclassified Roseobacter]MBF9050677.1 hypothetical protein [Rhodobacterales bacterium HKCCD4356]NNV11905.1 hypothetical protein [Roseobacter sp. HKCCD7357]NNV16918.1 hypothetical protein [Roseobacter sp. HKCCD8768]NNV26147.1 hypothetical protein [Roseobacter sp. HKCCD8192]NNV30639.1 hypothetical protein [Roseobacter sp. HKCCD9061]